MTNTTFKENEINTTIAPSATQQAEQRMALTKEQIRFIRRPMTSVCFRYVRETDTSTLELRDKAKAELDLICKVGFHDYGESRRQAYSGSGDGRPTRAFAMIHSPEFTHEWQTVVQLLKAGDVLEIDWHADAWANQYTKDAQTGKHEPVHVDHMTLSILRKDRKGFLRKQLTFILAHSICPDNTARMIQFKNYGW